MSFINCHPSFNGLLDIQQRKSLTVNIVNINTIILCNSAVRWVYIGQIPLDSPNIGAIGSTFIRWGGRKPLTELFSWSYNRVSIPISKGIFLNFDFALLCMGYPFMGGALAMLLISPLRKWPAIDRRMNFGKLRCCRLLLTFWQELSLFSHSSLIPPLLLSQRFKLHDDRSRKFQ